AQTAFPYSYIMPIGPVDNIVALRSVVEELANAIFGIDLFLIRDRDGLSDEIITTLESNVRFRALPRRHIENYLLDVDVLKMVADTFCLGSEQKNEARIRDALHQVASSTIMTGVLWNVSESIRARGTLSLPHVPHVEKMSRDQLAQSIQDHVAG